MNLNITLEEGTDVICNSMPEIDKITLELSTGRANDDDRLNFIMDYTMARKIIAELSKCLPETLIAEEK